MNVFVLERTNLNDEVSIAGIYKSFKSANIGIKHLIEAGFDEIGRWEIISYQVIEN